MVGTHIKCFGKSKHVGQSGTVVADYGSMLLVKADDQDYIDAGFNSSYEFKVFQVDQRYIKADK